MLFGECCSWCLWGSTSIINATRTFDVGSFYVAGPPGWWTLLLYAGLLAHTLGLAPRVPPRWLLSALLMWLALAFVVTGERTHRDELHCTFLSVGHGTCVVLELPGGETVLYDAGSLGSPDIATQTIASFLWSRGLTGIDALVLSHADVDHYNAVPGLIERFRIGRVYVSPLMFDPGSTMATSAHPTISKKLSKPPVFRSRKSG